MIYNKVHPLVTIFIPTFNRRELLKRAVSSALLQTYKNIEIIIVDDGSDDGTDDLILDWAQKDQRIFFAKKITTVKGAPASRNIAIQAASGKFITGLDDDDWLEESHIQDLLEAYQERYSFTFSRSLKFKDYVFSPVISYTKLISLKQITYINFVGNQVFTETRKIREINGFDENLPALQDYDAWIRLLEKFGPAKLTNTTSYHVDESHNSDRITSNPEKRIAAFHQFLKKHDARLSKGARLTRRAMFRNETRQRLSISDLTLFLFVRSYRVLFYRLKTLIIYRHRQKNTKPV